MVAARTELLLYDRLHCYWKSPDAILGNWICFIFSSFSSRFSFFLFPDHLQGMLWYQLARPWPSLVSECDRWVSHHEGAGCPAPSSSWRLLTPASPPPSPSSPPSPPLRHHCPVLYGNRDIWEGGDEIYDTFRFVALLNLRHFEILNSKRRTMTMTTISGDWGGACLSLENPFIFRGRVNSLYK